MRLIHASLAPLLVLSTMFPCGATPPTPTGYTAASPGNGAATGAARFGESNEKLAQARALRKARKYKEAEALLLAIIAAEPNNITAIQNLGLVYLYTKRYPKAVERFTMNTRLEPKQGWHHYLLGRALRRQGKYDESIAALTRAIELRPKLYYAYDHRGLAKRGKHDWQGALRDYDVVLKAKPYRANTYIRRGWMHRQLKQSRAALADFLIANTLDPNASGPDQWIKHLLTELKPAEVATDGAYGAPPAGLAITYLVTKSKHIQKDAMEESVEDLIAWFRPRPNRPKPHKKTRLLRRALSSEDGVTRLLDQQLRSGDAAPRRIGEFDYYRVFWRLTAPGPGGIRFGTRLDRKSTDALWPLTTGRKAKGTNEITLRCPDPLTPPTRFFGCDKPGTTITVGRTNWSAEVQGWQTVVVPAGPFKAARVHFTVSETFTLPAGDKTRSSTVTSWYAPELNWWVRRSRIVGKEQLLEQAIEVSRRSAD